MERRNFIKNTAVSGIAIAGLGGAMEATASNSKISNEAKFKLKYAPTLEMFKEHAGADPIDNIKFIADQGFRAVYDLGLINKPAALQEKIANEAHRLGLELGQFSLKIDWSVQTFVLNNADIREMLKKKMQIGVDLQKRTGINTALLVPGLYDLKLSWDYQTANVIENMRMCCDIAGKTGLELVMEPVNTLTNHPGVFLSRMPQAKMICVAVNHPSCKFVDDMYHQQITEGNLIPNIDMSWDYIGAFHIGDNPGRNEPTTGEINYKNIFKHIYDKGYKGILSCEHGKSKPGKEGELAVIKAYREVDSFEV
ncbi:MAG: TIM barrel protein [Bacteroidetes bacterium]|nr:TIM barrel protein [Bacteroidota bacterium]MCL6101494.1 TIM barrel protein [Bacteroidota bacterium]